MTNVQIFNSRVCGRGNVFVRSVSVCLFLNEVTKKLDFGMVVHLDCM